MDHSEIKFNPSVICRKGYVSGSVFASSLIKLLVCYLVASLLVLSIFILVIGNYVDGTMLQAIKGIFNLSVISRFDSITAQILLGLINICFFLLLFINVLKRVRDIRGTDEDELKWKVAILVIAFIPYINSMALVFILLKAGILSSGNTATSIPKWIDGLSRQAQR